jgi:2-polyprenyl-3-methyl-5-hydroxy-6-metoxy-1,4-benzoquinol methylase
MPTWTDLPRTAAIRASRRLIPVSLRASLKAYRRLRLADSQWDADYASGAWQWLHSGQELPRYSVIVGYCRQLKPSGSVLDIGCGEGLLARWLAGACPRYVGIDLSAEAIALARAKSLSFAEFEVADAADYRPTSQFDVVVFNECLYYFDRPSELASRLAGALAPGGVVIVSLNQGLASTQIWRMLRNGFHELEQVEIRNRAIWKIAVLQPHAGSAAGTHGAASQD